jgi:energy-coupling factor transport system permease protein
MLMLKDITIGQYIAGDSFIHKMDPRGKIFAVFILMAALFTAKDGLSYSIVAAFTLFIILLSQIPVKHYLKGLKPLLIIIALTSVMHFFLTPGEEIWSWGILKLTREGLWQGFFMGLRLALLIIITSVLTLSTTPISLTDGIEKLLNPFKKIGIPAHELAMMMTIALRFIPTLIEETEKIMNAQKARGADFESGNLIKRAKALIPILVPLFISSFRRADDLAIAMEARCYRGGEGRTRLRELAYSSRDFFALAVVTLLLVSVIYLKITI